MKARCTRKTQPDYGSYGGRGITVCDKWMNSFSSFLSDMGERPSKEYSLDRINNELGYSLENCRWSDKFEQAGNKRNSNPSVEMNCIACGVGMRVRFSRASKAKHCSRKCRHLNAD
jgi:hypothetical protein